MDKTHFSLALLLPQHWPVWLIIGLWWLLVQVLPYRAQMWLGAKIGRLAAMLVKRRRIVARKNLDLCFPELSEEARDKLFWETMESTGKGLFDTGIAWFWPLKRLEKIIEVNGFELLAEARREGRGVLLLTYHTTSLEVGIAAVNMNHPHDNQGVYRPHGSPVYDYVMRKGRERVNKSTEALPRKAVRAMVHALRRGSILIYLPDQDYGRRYSVFVPFFGVEAATLKSPSQLMKMGHARALWYSVVRKTDGSGYQVQVSPAPEEYGSGDELNDARLMNQFLEKKIRDHPDQYLWVHRRFKSQPDNNNDFYGLKKLGAYERRAKRRAKKRARRQVSK